MSSSNLRLNKGNEPVPLLFIDNDLGLYGQGLDSHHTNIQSYILEAGQRGTVMVQTACLSGLFAHPHESSLSEAMLTDPNSSVLMVAATSLTLSSHQGPFAIELLQRMQGSTIVRIGDAFQEAKQSLEIEYADGLREISDTFALFGDPSTIMVRS
jgi:hypothetical protein